MTTTLTPDICVIGAGSGGLTVAAAAASFGVQVVLIEKGEMGGDCLNYGCVPSKALLAAGHHAQAIRDGKTFGVNAPEPEIDFSRVHDHIREVIGSIAPNDSQERFEAMGVTVLREAAIFTDKKTVRAGDTEIKARRFVVATGSGPAVPPIEGLDTVPYFTNETLFDNTERPRHLIIIGGGPIGMEMAQAHRQLGSQVTVLEGMKPLGKDDPELTSILLESLEKEGIDIRGGAKVVRIAKGGGEHGEGVDVTLEVDGAEETVSGSHLLVAAGRKANVEGLGLEAAGIEYDRRGIKVDSGLKTTNPKVYAVGDVAGGLQFTHVAGYQAGLVVRSVLFRLPVKNRTDHIPWVTFTAPELAHVGQTEAQARQAGTEINVLRWPYAENDRAQAERETKGLIKVVVSKKGKILGASIVGAQAGETINTWALAVSKGMNVRDMTGYVPPYPTLSEVSRRASVTYFAPFTQKGWVRGAIDKLRAFG